jgi:Zn-dependent membrane protease YugP
METIVLLVAFLIVLSSTLILKIIYKIFSNKDNINNVSGYEAAKKILKDNDLEEIKVGKIGGELSDYYSNGEKQIMLSTDIYDDKSIASVAVAAHECGHAIQYKNNYFPIKLRNRIVPFVNFGNTVGYIVIMISLATSLSKLFMLGIILISFAILFQLITLPIEINASKRGKKELLRLNIIEKEEVPGVKIMLLSAGFTYLAGLLSSILQIIRLIYIFQNRRRD